MCRAGSTRRGSLYGRSGRGRGRVPGNDGEVRGGKVVAHLTDEIAAYLTVKRRDTAPATVEQYRFILERVLLPWCEANEIRESGQLDVDALNRFSDELRTRKLSIHSVKTYLRGAKLFLKARKAPIDGFKEPRAPKRLLNVLTRLELDRLENAAFDERDRLIVRVLADTGIRVGELLGLRAEDVIANRHDKKFSIRVIGKGDKEREVPVPRVTGERLKYYADHGAKRDYIFCAKRLTAGESEPLTRSGVDRLFRHLKIAAKISKPCHPHSLRHAYATFMLGKGHMSAVLLQKVLGHETLSMISTVYAHNTIEDTHRAMEEAFA